MATVSPLTLPSPSTYASHISAYRNTSSKSPPSSPGITVRRKQFVLPSLATTTTNPPPSSPVPATPKTAPPQSLQKSPSASPAKPKKKSGLLDWIRLCRSGKDLTSVGGKKLIVTEEELAKHNTIDDAWTAIRGKVYNITPYLSFHPGGAETMMQGAGKDCTLLFDEAHKYVKVESMLSKCFVGTLAPTSPTVQKRNSEDIVRKSREASPDPRPTVLTEIASEKSNSVDRNAAGASEEIDGGKSGSPESPSRLLVQEFPNTPASLTSVKPDVGDDSSVSLQLPAARLRKNSDASRPNPRIDWVESERSIVIHVMTQCNTLKTSDVVIDMDDKHLAGSIFINDWVYELKIELPHRVKSSQVAVNASRVEITLKKEDPRVTWGGIGTFLPDHGQLSPKSARDRKYHVSKVEEISTVSHDTKLFTVRFPTGSHFIVPMGHHVAIKAVIDGKLVERSYTPVLPLTKGNKGFAEGETVQFMIKLYNDGVMSQYLAKLGIGSTVWVSDSEGTFDAAKLRTATNVTLVAAGTGFTPMARIIHDIYVHDRPTPEETAAESTEVDRSVTLLFANKTEQDILWKEELEALSHSHQGFKVVNVLSAAENSWKGQKGRISDTLLKKHLPLTTSSEVKSLICVCGPSPFTEGIANILFDLEIPDECIHCFT